MNLFDVSALSGEELIPIRFPVDDQEYLSIFIQDLFTADSYAAAIAVEGSNMDLTFLNYLF